MNYEAWRATFQSSEQAAKAAFADTEREHQMLLNTLARCNELDANLQRIIEAATAEGPGPLTQAAIEEMPTESLKALCIDQQQQGCLRASEELRNGPIDWNKFGDDPKEQAANVAILVSNQIGREALDGLPQPTATFAQNYERLFAMVIGSLVEVAESAGVRKEDQLMGGTTQTLNAIEKLKERREKWKARALKAEQWNREMVAKAVNNNLEGYRELGSKAAAAEQERDALAAHIERITGLCRDLDECELGSEAMANVWGEIEDALISQPANSLAQRDALKLAEFIEKHAENLGACTRNYADKLAHDLRRQANGVATAGGDS